jgi:hypothetical protein
MPGGLLNLVSSGNQNILLTGNPQKTFWTSTYKRYTNFGMQNFRLDYEGLRQLNLNTPTTYMFKVKRYAELFTESFFVMQLPDIYSPIYPPANCAEQSEWVPYEFKWIKNLGAMMIQSIRFSIGGAVIQQMSGYDMVALANRDYDPVQKAKWDQLVGNVPELNDPANAFGRVNAYPNATYQAGGAEPSIRGRQLRVPIPIFWTLVNQQAFPLVCLQYNELYIEVIVRPLRELFQIRDVTNVAACYPVVAPNFNLAEHQFYRFTQTPPLPDQEYEPATTSWNENVHLSSTYIFLTDEEAKVFALNQQQYLFKELHDSWYYKTSVADKVWLQNSTGMVTSWIFLFQRSDVNARNEWSNFTNWSYDYLPFDVQLLAPYMEISPCMGPFDFHGPCSVPEGEGLGYGLNPSGAQTGLYGSGASRAENQRDILVRLGILFDGTVREEERPAEMYRYDQQYLTSPGRGDLQGMYCYNFCLNTSPFVVQPSGAVNLSKYSKVELTFATITPPVNPDASFTVLCDPETGATIATSKSLFSLYNYTYNLLVVEERYNVLIFSGGNAALMFAR